MRRWLAFLIVPLILLAGSARVLAAVVCPSGSVLEGVDVSQFDGSINWTQVAGSEKVFAFTAVSDGTHVDATFDTNYTAIKAAGLQLVTSENFLKDVNVSGTLSLSDKGITNANLTKALPTP